MMGVQRKVSTGAATVAVLLLSFSCGGESGHNGPAGVPRSATVPSLDTEQRAVLCDWINASVGGYGSIDNCDGGGSRHADSTPQSCVSGLNDFGACPSVTVGTVEDCINAIGGDLCRIDTAPACAPVAQCGSGNLDGGA